VVTLLQAFAPLSAQHAAATTSTLRLPAYVKRTLPNGLTLLLMEQHEVPLVSLSIVVRAGGVADPSGKEGTASLTADLLRKGAGARSATQIAEELDFVGGELETMTDVDSTTISAEFLKKDIATGIDLLADVLMRPTFPADEVANMLALRRDEVKAVKDSAQDVIGLYFNAFLFGTHPYGRPVDGDERSLSGIGRNDLAAFYAAHYVPGNTIVAIVGDFPAADMERSLAERFAAWPSRPVPRVAISEPAPVQDTRLLLVDKPDATQTFFQIGNVGIARTNADRVGLQVVNTVFGERFTSWINTELRIKTGLTYGARSRFARCVVPGAFYVDSYTPTETTAQALDLTLATLARLHSTGISAAELQSAKAYVKGQFPLKIETGAQLAATIGDLERFGLDAAEIDGFYAKLDAVTLADARRIVKAHFPRESLVFVLIGKASEIAPIARKYAPTVTTRHISDVGF